jgi:hypothetical protein
MANSMGAARHRFARGEARALSVQSAQRAVRMGYRATCANPRDFKG